MADFWYTYFIGPIEKGTGYNIVNTIAYGIILIIAIFVLIKVLKRLNIKMDTTLWIDLLPFVFLGGILRALEDANYFAFLPGNVHWIFITPLIYLLVFAFAFGSLLISRHLKKNITRELGVFLVIFFGTQLLLESRNWYGFAIVAALTLCVFGAVYLLVKFLKMRILDGVNSHVLFAHALDACASFTAVSVVGGYVEQHVLPSALFSVLPVWTFIPIKVAVVLLVLYVINQETRKNPEWAWMLKFTVFVLGMGPGVRNAGTILLGTNLF